MWFSGTHCERHSEIASYTPTYIVSILKGYHVLYQIWWYVMILPSVLFDFLSYVNLFYTERNIYKLADCKYICTLPTQSRWGMTCCICGKCMEWFGCLDAVQELEESKRQREWAFAERDKIVSERDEVRVLCDQLRHERDGAVSDLFSALRDSDDIRRQKNDAIRELKDFRYWSHTHIWWQFSQSTPVAPLMFPLDLFLGCEFSWVRPKPFLSLTEYHQVCLRELLCLVVSTSLVK